MAFECAAQMALRHPVGMVQRALPGPQSDMGTGTGSGGMVVKPPLHEGAFETRGARAEPVCLKQKGVVDHMNERGRLTGAPPWGAGVLMVVPR